MVETLKCGSSGDVNVSWQSGRPIAVSHHPPESSLLGVLASWRGGKLAAGGLELGGAVMEALAALGCGTEPGVFWLAVQRVGAVEGLLSLCF